MSVFLSIIVPVYNVADYLKRGIDSILSQSFQDFELILVDDGSTDLSGKICDEYASSDSRIQVIHKENGGVSSARNAGLDTASGEWVHFMDPDDELLPDALLTFVEGVCEEVDVVMGGFEEISIKGDKVLELKVRSTDKRILSREESLYPVFIPYSDDYSLPNAYLGYLWLRIFRREVVEKCHIRFDEKIRLKEAGLFVVNYLCASRGTSCYIKVPVYRYNRREASATISNKKTFNEIIYTSFDASVLMLRLVKGVYPSYSFIVKKAEEELLNTYDTIRIKMSQFGIKSDEVLPDLKKRCIKECGVVFLSVSVFKRKVRKMKGKLLNEYSLSKTNKCRKQ